VIFMVLERFIWVVGLLLQVFILWQMLRRGLVRQYRFFFLYIAFILVKDIILTMLYIEHRSWYTNAYYVGDAGAIALSLMVLEEVLRNTFQPFAHLRKIGYRLFIAASVIALGFAVLSGLAPGQDENALTAALLVMERGIRVMQVVMLLSLISMASVLRISWFDQGFGIMVGYGIFVSMELVIVALNAGGPHLPDVLVRILPPMAFFFAQVTWGFYATRSIAIRNAAAVPAASNEAWNQAMQEYLQQ
jgi:hypothetical protein